MKFFGYRSPHGLRTNALLQPVSRQGRLSVLRDKACTLVHFS
jgi:hypothetical protein